MNKWLADQAGMVERHLESIEWQGKPCLVVALSRIYPTSIDDLWDAIVSPDRLKRWFSPISGDLREGGKYQLEGNAGGTITLCTAPQVIEVTWEYGGEVGWVNVQLTPCSDNSTRLSIQHIAHEVDALTDFLKEYGPGSMGIGWDLGFLGLAQYLRSDDEPFTPFAIQDNEWTTTDQGTSFVKAASDKWVEAAIEFGTDSLAAKSAGTNAFNFYTGQESASNDA